VKVFLTLLATVCPLLPGARAAADPVAPAAEAGAAYQFSLAKLLAAEGAFEEALAAYEKAEALGATEPYILIDHAQLLARAAQAERAAAVQADRLRQAAEIAERARRLAPDNPDVLRAIGAIHLDLSAHDPAALAVAQEAFEAIYRQGAADPQTTLLLGRLYFDRAQTDQALEVFRKLVHDLPQNRTAYAFLIETLMRAEKKEEAEKALTELLAFAPDSVEARLTLAELKTGRGDHRGAAETLGAAPDASRGDPRLRRQLAWALYMAGDIAPSLATVEPLLARQPGDPHLLLLKGLLRAAEGQNEEAAALLARVREGQLDDPALARALAQVLERGGRRDEAARVLADVVGRLAKAGKAEEERSVRLDLAEVHFGAGRWPEGEAALAPLLAAADPAVRTQALLVQADALIEAKRYGEALDALGKAGDSPLVVSRRAEALLRAGREAEAAAQLAALSAGGDPQAVLAAAQAYQRADQYEPSIPLLKGIVERRPDDLTANFLLGTAYERTGRHQEAVARLRRVLEIEPDFHAALNYLGYMWAEKGENLEEALAMVRRAVALEPDNGAYVDSLGWAYFRLGRYEQARDLLERAARLEPGDATLHEHLGDVYVALGQTDKAREVYRRALELDDDNAAEVRRKLDRLRDGARR
jgi:tetratricopeptide (TPR) repeat protein